MALAHKAGLVGAFGLTTAGVVMTIIFTVVYENIKKCRGSAPLWLSILIALSYIFAIAGAICSVGVGASRTSRNKIGM